MYPRYPSAININYYGVLPGEYSNHLTQAESATVFTRAIAEFHCMLSKGK